MLFLWLILFSSTTASGTKLVRFGEVASAETLFPVPTHSTHTTADSRRAEEHGLLDRPAQSELDPSSDSEHHFESEHPTDVLLTDYLNDASSVNYVGVWEGRSHEVPNGNDDQDGSHWPKQRRADDPDSDSNDSPDETLSDDSDEAEFSGDDPDISIFEPDNSPAKKKPASSDKKDTNDDVPDGPMRGVMQLDCLETPEGCQNACYYQNCIMEAKGDYRKVTYQRAGEGMNAYNRVQSGVAVSGGGTPCKTGPFAQKFWDTYPFNIGGKFPKEELKLETDEWPMASMYNPDFDPSKENARSLRCSTKWGNGRAGLQAGRFYQGSVEYRRGGKWRKHRSGSGELNPGDKFHVNSNFDSFEANNPAHDKIRK
jgi:hypothetical protein